MDRVHLLVYMNLFLHQVLITPLQGPHHRRHLRFAHSQRQLVQLALEKQAFHTRFRGEPPFSLQNGMLHAGAGWLPRQCQWRHRIWLSTK